MSDPKEEDKIEKKSSVGRGLIKVVLYVLLICAPILILMLIFTPFAEKKITKRIASEYALPADYKQGDVTETVKKMSRDPEFLFYFFALDRDSVAQATYESYEIMNRARDKELFLNEILELQKKTKALAVMFYHLDYSEDYIMNPKKYPDLNQIMTNFLFEEFKLAVLGVCYKSTFDEEFKFQWDKTSRLAAQKLNAIIRRMGQPK